MGGRGGRRVGWRRRAWEPPRSPDKAFSVSQFWRGIIATKAQVYFFGKLSWVAAIIVFIATWQAIGEVIAIGLAAGAWFLVWSVSKSIIQADRGRTERKKFEKQVAKDIRKYEKEFAAPIYRPNTVPQTGGLPEWSIQLTPNRQEWLEDKIAEGKDRSEVERRLKLQMVEWGWIE